MTNFPMLFLGESHVLAYAIMLLFANLLGVLFVLFDLTKILNVPWRKEFNSKKVSASVGRHIILATAPSYIALVLYTRGTIAWETFHIIAAVGAAIVVAHCIYKIRFSPPDNKNLV